MIRHYFKTAWRSIRRNRLYSTLNILGLALGIASCIIISLVIKYELGYDAFNKKADRIYRVTLNAIDFNPSVSMAIAPAMRTSFPELEKLSQIRPQSDVMVVIGETKYAERNYSFADQSFTAIFDYEWISGNPVTALAEPNTVVLTASIAKKYFADNNAMGQVIQLNNHYTLKVTGIIKDPPGNSSLPFDFFVSYETVKPSLGEMASNFYAIAGGQTYILLAPGYHIETLRKKIPGFIEMHWGKEIASGARLPLQPLRDIHFDQRYLSSFSPTVSKDTYWALAAIAAFIIVIACINFINLATAQAIRRAREIGVRKVLGSNRSQLIGQFLGETTLMVLAALLLAAGGLFLFLPQLATWLGLKLELRQLTAPGTLLLVSSLTVVMILLAGLYPAFVQSAFNPIRSLKSQAAAPPGSLNVRKSLVVLQFAISQIMIFGTLVVALQMDFFNNRDLGFDKEAVISIGIPNRAKRDEVRKMLADNPGVKEFSFSSGAPAYNRSFTDFSSPELGMNKGDVTEMKFVDEKYIGLFKMKMLAGQPIMRKDSTDTTHNAVINETMMQKLQVKEPQNMIGRHIMLNGWHTTVTGVVADFQSESKHKERRPCALLYEPRGLFSASIKLQPSAMKTTIATIDKQWSALFPDRLFDYEFLDEHIASWYRQEEKQYTAFKMFAAVAILIGCLGLYGLVAFAAAQRRKEVGIRKILGASLSNIVLLFSKEFVLLILLAFLLAAPIGYFIMHNWLQNFAYKISIGANVFIISILVSAVVAGLTIGYQALRAGKVNPVKSLRSE